jgi:hypothetical protein
LRERYNLLLLKLLALLQDEGSQLAHVISASRGSVWVLLSDPVELAKL